MTTVRVNATACPRLLPEMPQARAAQAAAPLWVPRWCPHTGGFEGDWGRVPWEEGGCSPGLEAPLSAGGAGCSQISPHLQGRPGRWA